MSFDRRQFEDLYPFAEQWLDLGGPRMHYVDEGDGPPVVCVHGNPSWSLYFRALIKALRVDHRVIAPDHIGCGLSDKPADEFYEYTLTRRVADLESLLDHIGLQQGVTLVVHDWGGMIGFAAALRRPGLISRIVLSNTAAFLLPAGKRMSRRLQLLHRFPRLASLFVRGLNGFSLGATYMAVTGSMSQRLRAAYTAPYDTWQNRIATLRFVQDIPLRPGHPSYALAKWTDDRLHRLRDVPMLILWGESDFVFGREFLAEWRRRFPAAEVHRYPHAGHYVLEDECADYVARVRRFLADHPVVAVNARHEETPV